MSINQSSYKSIIAANFDYTWDFEFLDLVATALERVEDLSDEGQIYDAANDSTIYYKDQWTILQHYCTPTEANWEKAFEQFHSDLIDCANRILNETSDEE